MNAIDLMMMTQNSARTLHIEERYGVGEGKPASFIVLEAETEYEAVRNSVDRE